MGSWNDWLLIIGLYGVFWWLAFLAVQPFGTITQDEVGEQEPGTPASAPVGFPLKRKLWQASLAAGLVTAAVVLLARWGVVPL